MNEIRHDWSAEEVRTLYGLPLMELVHKAQTLHRSHHPRRRSAALHPDVHQDRGMRRGLRLLPSKRSLQDRCSSGALFDVKEVLGNATKAKEMGATRFCMGAAWREVRDGPQFDSVLEMVRGVREMGMEACVTLGMLKEHQAEQLAEAGLTAYNHNLDSSEAFYDKIITTRTYADRLRTIQNVRKAGITVCSGGILGLGETEEDRGEMRRTLATMNPHPESVPINRLVPVEGTPLANQEAIDTLEIVRAIAVARILMPKSMVRLSAGREDMSQEAQVLCMMAGANSIFYGEELLTTPIRSAKTTKRFSTPLEHALSNRRACRHSCWDSRTKAFSAWASWAWGLPDSPRPACASRWRPAPGSALPTPAPTLTRPAKTASGGCFTTRRAGTRPCACTRITSSTPPSAGAWTAGTRTAGAPGRAPPTRSDLRAIRSVSLATASFLAPPRRRATSRSPRQDVDRTPRLELWRGWLRLRPDRAGL